MIRGLVVWVGGDFMTRSLAIVKRKSHRTVYEVQYVILDCLERGFVYLQFGDNRKFHLNTYKCESIWIKKQNLISKGRCQAQELTNIFVPRRGNHERSSSRLLRYPVIVNLPVERFAILTPTISVEMKGLC